MTFTYTFAAGTANNAGFTVYTNSMTIGQIIVLGVLQNSFPVSSCC